MIDLNIKGDYVLCLKIVKCSCGRGERVDMMWTRKGKRVISAETVGVDCDYCSQYKEIDCDYVMQEKRKQIFIPRYGKKLS